MNALPPLKSLGWWDHRHIMRWWGVLLCDPGYFSDAEDRLPRLSQGRVFITFLLHLLPYAAVVGVAKIAVMLSLLAPAAWNDWSLWSPELVHVSTELLLIFGIAAPIGTAAAIKSGPSIPLLMTLSWGMVQLFFLDSRLQFDMNASVILGLGSGAFMGQLIAGSFRSERLPFDMSPTLLSVILAVLIGITAFYVEGAPSGLAAAAGVLLTMGRLLYLPWHWLLLIGAPSLMWQRRHPVFWDRAMLMTLPGTERFLLRFCTRWPNEARALLADIVAHSPGQRAVALRAKARAGL